MLYLFAAVLALFIVATTPQPKSLPPADLENIKVPTAEEGRAIPVLFGTRVIEGPNVVWYGDFKTQEVKG